MKKIIILSLIIALSHSNVTHCMEGDDNLQPTGQRKPTFITAFLKGAAGVGATYGGYELLKIESITAVIGGVLGSEARSIPAKAGIILLGLIPLAGGVLLTKEGVNLMRESAEEFGKLHSQNSD
jgi:hypothetical protein